MPEAARDHVVGCFLITKWVRLAPPPGFRVGPLDLRLEVDTSDAVVATGADLGRTVRCAEVGRTPGPC